MVYQISCVSDDKNTIIKVDDDEIDIRGYLCDYGWACASVSVV